MKSISSIALASTLFLGLSLNACGSSSDQSDDTSDEAAARTKIAARVARVDLVSDRSVLSTSNRSGVPAVDPSLKNAWGLVFGPTGNAWVSNAGTSTATVYDPSGKLLLTTTLPTGQSPTGQVFNPSATDFKGDHFITVTEEGGILGWQNGTAFALRLDHKDENANYKGAALVNHRLYVTDFRAGTVDIYDSNYNELAIDGAFKDPTLPRGFAPFNVWNYDDFLFVSYAKQDSTGSDDVSGAGNGFISVFDQNGRFVQRLISGGALNSPWGLAVVETSFGPLKKDTLLVGNFGDGRVNAYQLKDARHGYTVSNLGSLRTASGAQFVIDGLWGLAFDANNRLYFTAGPGEEQHGMFGRIETAGY